MEILKYLNCRSCPGSMDFFPIGAETLGLVGLCQNKIRGDSALSRRRRASIPGATGAFVVFTWRTGIIDSGFVIMPRLLGYGEFHLGIHNQPMAFIHLSAADCAANTPDYGLSAYSMSGDMSAGLRDAASMLLPRLLSRQRCFTFVNMVGYAG